MRLRDLRMERNLTLKDVSEAIDYGISDLSRVEREVQVLTMPLAKKLAAFYGVTLDELVEEKGNEDDSIICSSRK